jgi:hypothetical protein
VGKVPTMAFVTAKARGRFEIRETRRTSHGPRATTLVSFRALTDDVLEQVRQRATGPVNVDHLCAGARRVGAPIELGRVDQLARQLLGAMASGSTPSPGLGQALVDVLTESGIASDAGGELAGLAQWIGVADEARADALVELLQLADAIPTRRVRRQLEYPRLVSSGDG